MIKRLTMDRVEEAARLAHRLNQSESTKCLSMSMEYDVILATFKRYIESGESDFLIYLEGDEIIGICNFDPEHSDEYVQTSGGIFASKGYEQIAGEFYDFLITHYKGYEFYSSYAAGNENARMFWLSVGAEIDDDSYIYETSLTDYVGSTPVLGELELKDYPEFRKLLNDTMGDAFWNGDKMVQDDKLMGNFKVNVIKDNDKITGYIATRVSKGYSETYFIYAEEPTLKNIKDLLASARVTTAQICDGKYQYFVDRSNSVEIEALKKLGFYQVGTSTTYHYEKL